MTEPMPGVERYLCRRCGQRLGSHFIVGKGDPTPDLGEGEFVPTWRGLYCPTTWRAERPVNAVEVECPTCQGFACDEGCGQCEYGWAGPDSHRVCRTCRGAGVIEPCPVVVGQQHGPGAGLFITCGKPHAVADHPTDSDEGES